MTETILKSALDLTNKWGLFAAIVVFFIWRGDAREREMSARQDKMETYVRETLSKTLADSTTALAQNTAVLSKLTAATVNLSKHHLIQEKPK